MFFVGVDLGQSADYTAVCIGEKAGGGESPTAPYELRIRYLERFRGVPYPQVAERLEVLLNRLGDPYELAVDATGVGVAVVDLLRQRGLRFKAVTITGGNREAREGRNFRVPKRDLVAGLQVLLQTGRLKIASGLEHAETLRGELLAFRVKVSASGHDSYEAWREQDHDDLVLAACLASWAAERETPPVDETLATAEDPW
ncbi:MAG: hypothetical protein M3P49_08050 [Actinomycetota bacterium]|nr:hypothetical protein [Actinomycetota bacterium]